MKRFVSVLCAVLVVACLCVPAFAAEPDSGVSDSQTVLVPDVNVYNEIVVPDGEDLGTYIGTSVYAMSPVGSEDASGLKAVMLALIGDWDSIVVEHAYQSSQGYTNYVREIQLDYPWLCSCAVFLVVLFCVLRGGFSVLCKR